MNSLFIFQGIVAPYGEYFQNNYQICYFISCADFSMQERQVKIIWGLVYLLFLGLQMSCWIPWASDKQRWPFSWEPCSRQRKLWTLVSSIKWYPRKRFLVLLSKKCRDGSKYQVDQLPILNSFLIYIK